MEKFNAIKILEEELKDKEIFDKNISKERYMKSVYKFIDDYIKPILEKKTDEIDLQAPQELIDVLTDDVMNDKNLTDEDKKIMTSIKTINAYFKDETLKRIIYKATDFINDLGLVDNIDDDNNLIEDEDGTILYILNEDELNFLSKDTKSKKKIANKLCDVIIGCIEYFIQ